MFGYFFYMAHNKKSFLLYCDLIHTVDQMPNELAGELFKHILSYVNDQNPVSENLIINLTFEPIKQSLKRDLVKYENIRLKNIENANKRWDKNNATASDRIPTDAKNAVSDSVSDSVSVNVSDSDKDSVKEKKVIKSKKILFKDSIYFDKRNFQNEFPSWNKLKLVYYYDSVLAWSNEGNKKIDWIATVKVWAARDEKEGKLKFEQPKSITSQYPEIK